MFGYVRPNKPELLMKEYDEYKAVYCTLCSEIGKHYGIFSRLSLSYDLTFYTMLALDITRAVPKVRKGRCVVNPTKRCNFICEGNEAYRKGAALTVIMAYHKIKDNIKDDGFFKSLAARMTMPFFSRPFKKACRDFPFMAESLGQMMQEQEAVENSETYSVDACCEPTAKALQTIFAELSGDDEIKKRILSQLGYFLGRWIYIMDAADDLKDDMKQGSFNPLIKRLELTGSEISKDKQEYIDNECNEILNNNVAMLISATNLLEFGRYGSIIENVTQKGLAEIQREILFLHVNEKNRKDKKI